MDNMWIYERTRSCPQSALRTIQAGKLKGKSDINPMFRIKMLTELFGPCGAGWKTTEETFWTTPGANGEVIAWCSIKLLWFDKNSGEWSEPVFGIGGSMLVDTQRSNLSSNDEAFKMAYTDAISVACKALGFAADVYWNQDTTKYSKPEKDLPPPIVCKKCGQAILPVKAKGVIYSPDQIAEGARKSYGMEMCWDCMTAAKQAREGAAE